MTVPTTSTTLLRDIGSSADNARWGEFVERYQGGDQREQGYIAQTLPQKPKSPLQRYRLLHKGREVLA